MEAAWSNADSQEGGLEPPPPQGPPWAWRSRLICPGPGGWAGSGLHTAARFSGPTQGHGRITVRWALQKRNNLLRFAEGHEVDYFLTKAEDARGDANYLWDLLISQSQATWETTRGQCATRNEICSCQINCLEILPRPFPSAFCQERSFSGAELTLGPAPRAVCARGQPEADDPGTTARKLVWATWGPVWPCCSLSVGPGHSHPILWAWLGFFPI